MCDTMWQSPHLSVITAPGPPQDLTLVNRTCHSITFQWSPPDTGKLNVTGYGILHNGTSVANITGTVYTLEGLTPDTVHTISVRTRNAIGPSVLEGTLTTAIEVRREYKWQLHVHFNDVDIHEKWSELLYRIWCIEMVSTQFKER